MDVDAVRNSLAFLFASPPGFPDSAAPSAARGVNPVTPSTRRPRPQRALRTHGHLSGRPRGGAAGVNAPRKIRRLLAIDDSPNLRAFIVQALSSQFPELIVTLAPDAREGLRLARLEKPDLILLDFVLPDLAGDEVCRQLLAEVTTADLPVVLMSSSSAEIESTQARYGNVVKALAKPFTPQLLGDTVGFILREPPGPAPTVPPGQSQIRSRPDRLAAVADGILAPDFKRADGPSPRLTPRPLTAETAGAAADGIHRRSPAPIPAHGIRLAGDTGQIPLINVLLALEQNRATGTLALYGESTPVEVHFADGQAVVGTTRDPDAWWRASVLDLDLAPESLHAELRAAQRVDGSPPPLLLVPGGTLDLPTARQWATETGLRLVADAWTAYRLRFQFEPAKSLPAFAAVLETFPGSAAEWAMETLRRVGAEYLSAHAWGEPTGIPAYTRKGYERIQTIPLTDDEHAFAECVHPQNSLAEIARRTGATIPDAQRILHRFLCLEILDYWPAALLRRE